MLIPGIFESDPPKAIEKIMLVNSMVKMIQVDVADGVLVDGRTFTDIEFLNTLPMQSLLEVHLMVKNPSPYTNKKISTVSRICSQVEADDIFSFVKKAKVIGYEVGLSLNPETHVEELSPYLGEVSYVQFMCVKPGGQGREFHKEVLNKISEFKSKNPQIRVQADGGISDETIPMLLKAGVNDVVIGSAIFN